MTTATAAALDLDSTALVEESRSWGTRRFATVRVRHDERPYGESNYTVTKLMPWLRAVAA